MTPDKLRAANILAWQINDVIEHIRLASSYDIENYFDADIHLGAPLYAYSGVVSRELILRHKKEVLADLNETLARLTEELESL